MKKVLGHGASRKSVLLLYHHNFYNMQTTKKCQNPGSLSYSLHSEIFLFPEATGRIELQGILFTIDSEPHLNTQDINDVIIPYW